MMHWSVSRSDEYCSCDNTATPLPCDAARSCPKSDEFADLWDTFSLKASILQGIPDGVCGAEHNPTVFSRVHRKKLASAERHADAYRLQAAVSDGLFRTKPALAGVEFPAGQIRRMKLLDRWLRAGLHTGESVFFSLKLRIVAFFPCFGSSKLDLFLMQNTAKRFKTDRRNDLFGNKIRPQFFQGPSLKRTAQKVRRTLGRFGDKGFVILGKFLRPARSRLGFQSFKAAFVKVFDNRSNMVFGIMNQLRNGRHFIALIGSQHHLGTANFDTAGTAAKYPLNLLALADIEVSGIQTHKKSLSMRNNIEFFLRVCVYNTHLCIAQVLNLQKVKIIFLKRH